MLGDPDIGLLTPPEMALTAGQIHSSVPDLPILVDADTGTLHLVQNGCGQREFLETVSSLLRVI